MKRLLLAAVVAAALAASVGWLPASAVTVPEPESEPSVAPEPIWRGTLIPSNDLPRGYYGWSVFAAGVGGGSIAPTGYYDDDGQQRRSILLIVEHPDSGVYLGASDLPDAFTFVLAGICFQSTDARWMITNPHDVVGWSRDAGLSAWSYDAPAGPPPVAASLWHAGDADCRVSETDPGVERLEAMA